MPTFFATNQFKREFKKPTGTPEWQKKLQTALREAQTGRGAFYGGEKEFLKALENNFAKPKGKPERRSK